MKINTLLKKVDLMPLKNNHQVFMLTDDSKACILNSVFIAIKGNTIDGHSKINEAITNGAKTIILEDSVDEKNGINYLYVESTKKILPKLFYNLYKKQIKKLNFIGIIGTNGKTSVSTILYRFLNSTNEHAMLIGSNGCDSSDFHSNHDNTTPSTAKLYSYFMYAYRKKIKNIIMEISSISIAEQRVAYINYNTLIFTNFSEDHLDYHKTMEEYFYTKLIPFINIGENGLCIINNDDKKAEIIKKYTKAKVITYGINNNADFFASIIKLTLKETSFSVNGIYYSTLLFGKMNIYNILPLICYLKYKKISNDQEINYFIQSLSAVNGRVNIYTINNRFIIIDYAHTEYATQTIISEIRNITGKIPYVILGCGGNREKEKRGKIGHLLSTIGCIPLLTNDNPRNEDPLSIINDINSGAEYYIPYVLDRKEAIYEVYSKMKENDVLLILGKGSEQYMEIMDKKIRYNDLSVIKELEQKI